MKRLYNKLMKLCKNNTMFIYKDDVTGMLTNIRMFDYISPSWDDWKLPGALDCRGIMFEMNGEVPVRIMARPMEKFFNHQEDKSLNDVDWNDVLFYMTKEDGSIISSYFDKGVVGLKSRYSLYSDHAYGAAVVLNGDEALKDRTRELGEAGFTVNFEYMSPETQIVIAHTKPMLRILNIRNNKTGEYVGMDEIYADSVLRPYLVDVFVSDGCNEQWAADVKKMVGIEGYVVVTNKNRFKIKTDWYFERSFKKEAICCNRIMCETVIANKTDDLRALFVADKNSIDKISKFEISYQTYLSDILGVAIPFITSYNHEDRKTYMLRAATTFAKNRNMFGVVALGYSINEDLVPRLVEHINENLRRRKYVGIIPQEYQR